MNHRPFLIIMDDIYEDTPPTTEQLEKMLKWIKTPERPAWGGAIFREVRSPGNSPSAGRLLLATDSELYWPYCSQMPRRPGWTDLPDGSDTIWRNGVGMPRALLPEGWSAIVERGPR